MDLNNSIFDVSVIMATYNSVWEKCVFTLESITGQHGINLELIVVDDGSADNMFDRFAEYLHVKGFENFRLIESKDSKGTLKNYYEGVSVAKGNYLKLISPGDALFSDTILSNWVRELNESRLCWSFGNAVYYHYVENRPAVVREPAFPRIIDCYSTNNAETCRWNYVVLEDVALGAALLCETDIFLNYLIKFLGQIKYAEDVVFNALMYDGFLPLFYDSNVIFYEYGSGVSTGEKKWKNLIQVDLRNAEIVIANFNRKDALQTRMSKALISMNSASQKRKRILKNFKKGGMKKVLKFRFNPRLSSDDITGCGTWWEDYEHRN